MAAFSLLSRTVPELRMVTGRPMPRTASAGELCGFLFEPAAVLPTGWYRLTLDTTSADTLEPKVFFDFGSGFNEMFSVRLRRVQGARYAGMIKLPWEASTIWVSATDEGETFKIARFRIDRLSLLRTAAGLSWHGMRLFRRNPSAFTSRLPEFWRALTQPRFIQMREQLQSRSNARGYTSWMRTRDYQPSRDRAAIVTAVEQIEDPPLISVLMPVFNTPRELLDAAIASVCAQIYPHWELCIADDCSTAPHVRGVIEAWRQRDRRIKVVFREHNGHIAEATNSAFSLASGAWVALLDHDDLLREHTLAEVALKIARHPDAQLIYSDEDKLGAGGERYDPYFKPDFSRELFRSQNYLNHLTLHRADNIRAVGGWRTGFEGAQDYDLNLRIIENIDPQTILHIPKVLYHWRAAEGSTAAAGSEKTYAYDAGLRALREHLERIGSNAKVEAAPDTPFYRIRMPVPEPQPLVSLIISTRDKVDLLKGCVESILTRTTYRNYEIVIVNNNSEEPETLAYFATLRRRPNVRILDYPAPFNFSAINNFAVEQAVGEIVGLINNDTEIISPGWLCEMVSWAAQPDIGCVGAKLYYANQRIQHAGVILGLRGVAGHSHKYASRKDPGYFYRLKVLQNLSAVTGACLLVRKTIYEEVGGLDEQNLKIAFNDVDFCLKVREAGYLVVWTPYAELYHFESLSRGFEDNPNKVLRFHSEIECMKGRWTLTGDPFYSPNLTLDREDFSIDG
jgi:GT2 family glycosyltransferase